MRKILAAAVVLSLIVGALGAPALAGKKKKKAAPVPVTMYFHGNEPLGELDMANNATSGALLPMDTTEPAGGQSKSTPILDAVATPNPNCSGSPILPSWSGAMTGRVTGDVKVVFNTIASAGNVDIELFVDAGPFSCNDAYIDPVAETTIDLPPGAGTVEAVIEGVNFEVGGILIVMVNPKILDPPVVGRILYDSPADASHVEFICTPAAGATTCTQ